MNCNAFVALVEALVALESNKFSLVLVMRLVVDKLVISSIEIGADDDKDVTVISIFALFSDDVDFVVVVVVVVVVVSKEVRLV